jgi:uncharacterized membrane protein YqjE
MSHTYGTPGETAGAGRANDQSTGELVSRLSQDVSQLVRDEMRLAQVEMSAKAKKAGVGAGMFGAAGVLALYGGGALVACADIALGLAVDLWLSALIVGIVLLAVAGVVALVGKSRVSEATPLVPTRTVENVKQDVDAVKHPHDH